MTMNTYTKKIYTFIKIYTFFNDSLNARLKIISMQTQVFPEKLILSISNIFEETYQITDINITSIALLNYDCIIY